MTEQGEAAVASKSHLAAAVGVVLLAVLPVLVLGFPRGHDFAFHVIWLEAFQKQIAAGDLYPRWLFDTNAGLGSPAFFFYGPLSYYLSSLLIFITGGVFSTAWILGWSAIAATFLSFTFAYRWLQGWAPPSAALLGAAFYTLTPYHVLIDLYNRGAFGEYWAFVWPPLVLWATDRMFASTSLVSASAVAATYALMCLAHAPTLVLFSPFLLAYVLWRAWRKWWLAGEVLASISLGAGVAAIFLLPALTEQSNIAKEMLQGDFFDYRNWFLFVSWTHPWSLMPDRWSWIVAMTVGASLAWFLAGRGRGDSAGAATFFLTSSGTLLVMMSWASAPVWAILPTLQAVQFPVRWVTVLTLTTSASVALGSASAAAAGIGGIRVRAAWALTALCVGISFLGISAWFVTRWRDIREGSAYSENLNLHIRNKIDSFILPRWAVRFRFDTNSASITGAVDSILRGQQAVIERQAGNSPRRLQFTIRGGEGRVIKLPVFYHPSWIAKDLSSGAVYPLTPSSPDGVVTLPVSRPEEHILLEFQRSSAERWGQWISFASLAIVAGLFLLGRLRLRSGY